METVPAEAEPGRAGGRRGMLKYRKELVRESSGCRGEIMLERWKVDLSLREESHGKTD